MAALTVPVERSVVPSGAYYPLSWTERKAAALNIERPAYGSGTGPGLTKLVATVMIGALLLVGAACGGQEMSQDASQGSSGGSQESGTSEGTIVSGGETTAREAASGEAAELAKAEVGPREETNMVPADGKEPDPARPLPEDPPEGIEVYPATTNATIEGPIEYDREPPTNGDHDPLWQNCGFYEQPIEDRNAVHSMDHGVVWISYREDLPAEQVDELRSYGNERYVIVSPYPGQDAPVIATSWRVQLELDGADDPRLREFVDQFRVSEIAPLSGNRCVGGVGDPAS